MDFLPDSILDVDDNLGEEGQDIRLEPVKFIKDDPSTTRCDAFEESEHVVKLNLASGVLNEAKLC